MYDISLILNNTQYKKCYLLMKALVFMYHGLHEEEKQLLNYTSQKIDGREELDWAIDFVSNGERDAFVRTKEYFEANFINENNDVKLFILEETWADNNKKGFITELEAVTILKFSKIMNVEKEFLTLVRSYN